MQNYRKHFIQLIISCVVVLCIVLGLFLLKRIESKTVSVKELIDAKNGDIGVSQVIALTELTEEYDLVFYKTLKDHITPNIIVKDNSGYYIDLIMTSERALDGDDDVVGSSRNSLLPGHTLYWGIAQSQEWKINHPNAHQIVVDNLVLGFYFHDESLEEKTLDLKFVRIENR